MIQAFYVWLFGRELAAFIFILLGVYVVLLLVIKFANADWEK